MRVTNALLSDLCELPVDHKSGSKKKLIRLNNSRTRKLKHLRLSTLDPNRNSNVGDNQGQLSSQNETTSKMTIKFN